MYTSSINLETKAGSRLHQIHGKNERMMTIPRNVLLFVFSSIVFFVSLATNAQGNLWDNAKTGMTIEEVRNTYPNAIVLRDPEEYVDGMEGRLRIDDFEVSDIPMSVKFLFSDHKLQIVLLVVDSESRLSEQRFRTYIRELSALLWTKYGEPVTNTTRDDEIAFRIIQSWDVRWPECDSERTLYGYDQ